MTDDVADACTNVAIHDSTIARKSQTHSTTLNIIERVPNEIYYKLNIKMY